MREEATNLDDCADTRHNVTTKWGAETGKLCQANKKKLSQICPLFVLDLEVLAFELRTR